VYPGLLGKAAPPVLPRPDQSHDVPPLWPGSPAASELMRAGARCLGQDTMFSGLVSAPDTRENRPPST
jgi:hypothetical protein